MKKIFFIRNIKSPYSVCVLYIYIYIYIYIYDKRYLLFFLRKIEQENMCEISLVFFFFFSETKT